MIVRGAARAVSPGLDKGLIDEALIDARLFNLFKVRMRLGHFDPVGPLQAFPMTDICSDYALALSENGLVQSTAMLKNADKALPLAASTKTVAVVIGPNANLSKSDVSYYGPRQPCGGNYWTIGDAVAKHSSAAVQVALGVPNVLSSDTSGTRRRHQRRATAEPLRLRARAHQGWRDRFRQPLP